MSPLLARMVGGERGGCPVSDERRRARERLAAQGDPEAAAAAGRAACRTDGCDVRAWIARDEGGSPWLRVEVGPGLVHAFPLTLEDTAAEWAVTLNCDPTFRACGLVAVPRRASLSVHGARCPRCGDTAGPVDVDGVASRSAQKVLGLFSDGLRWVDAPGQERTVDRVAVLGRHHQCRHGKPWGCTPTCPRD